MDQDLQHMPPEIPSSTSNIAPQPAHQVTPLLIFFIALSTLLIGLIGGYLFATHTSILPITPAVQRNAGVEQTQHISPTMGSLPTPTADTMKTYTNTQFGLSFQYPSSWETMDAFPGSAPSSLDIIGLTPANHISKDSAAPIYVEHYDNPTNLSLHDFESQHNANSAMATQFYYPDASISQIGGYTAYTKDKAHCEPFFCTNVTIMAKNNIFIFFNVQNTTQFSPTELTANADIFNQLIASIKFTNNR